MSANPRPEKHRRRVPPYDYYGRGEQRPVQEILDDIAALNDPWANLRAGEILVEKILSGTVLRDVD